MNQSEALNVVRSLANGVDPSSGEVFPAQSPYQRADIVRALFVAAEALERSERFSRRREDLPSKAGQPWTDVSSVVRQLQQARSPLTRSLPAAAAHR